MQPLRDLHLSETVVAEGVDLARLLQHQGVVLARSYFDYLPHVLLWQPDLPLAIVSHRVHLSTAEQHYEMAVA